MKRVSLDCGSGKNFSAVSRVTIKDGKITAVELLERHETT